MIACWLTAFQLQEVPTLLQILPFAPVELARLSRHLVGLDLAQACV